MRFFGVRFLYDIAYSDGNLTAPAVGGGIQDDYQHEKHAGGASTGGGGIAGLAGVAGVGGREGSEGAAVEPPAGATAPPRQRAM